MSLGIHTGPLTEVSIHPTEARSDDCVHVRNASSSSHLFYPPSPTTIFMTSGDHLKIGVCVRNEKNFQHSNKERYRINRLLRED